MPRSRRDTAGAVVASLTELVLTGQLHAGDLVIESDIAARLGVSRTPVREAIAQLVSRGLLVKENNRSARVHRPSLNDLIEIYEMRIVLECFVARQAALDASSERIRELRAIEKRLRSADEADDKWFQDHGQFHHTVVLAASRPRFQAAIQALQHQSEPYVRLVTKLDTGRHNQVREQHQELVKAIAARDADRAEELTRLHLTTTVERVTEIFEAAGRFILPAEKARNRLKEGTRR